MAFVALATPGAVAWFAIDRDAPSDSPPIAAPDLDEPIAAPDLDEHRDDQNFGEERDNQGRPNKATPDDGTATPPGSTITVETAPIPTTPAEPAPAQTTTAPVQTTVPTSLAPAAATPVRPAGDLGLPLAMSNPACDGRWITIVGSAVKPPDYVKDTIDFLNANPGTNYLRTSTTGCRSLRRYFTDGSEIYAAYYGPFNTWEEACRAVHSLAAGAYAKPLDNTTDPGLFLTRDGC